ncbi:MAG: HAD-IB family phosphatase [Methylococcaceae bacterium]|nr:HAD-IB family phosphatase [Methylococcaceae bacterium]MDP3905257.1 HAD-IB family phosphatase [Methylococcaceae bacterium]
MSFDIICFDCDSTLSKIEGIDELARREGLGAEMARLTNAAMNGEVKLEAVYGQRLSAIRPNKQSIDWLAEAYIAERVDGVEEVFAQLLALGKTVHIVSGGLRQAILPLARYLGLPEEQVHAVDVYFNKDGSYQDFDEHSPLARNGGKAEICRQLLKPDSKLVMVGDGNTDMEAKQAGAYVVGFGGVVDRAIVRELADVYCPEANLKAVLTHVL